VTRPLVHRLGNDGTFPNGVLPALVYRGATIDMGTLDRSPNPARDDRRASARADRNIARLAVATDPVSGRDGALVSPWRHPT
jgi:hypothetical protein